MKNKLYKSNKGFSLVEVLVASSLALIVFLSLFGLYQFGFKLIVNSRARIIALSLANQRIEQIKNISYPDIEYSPNGEIIQIENVFDGKYTILTTIIPVLDCFDGPEDLSIPECVEAPLLDSCEIDYKRLKIEVAWNFSGKGSVILTNDVFPITLTQECEQEKGILSVLAIDANSQNLSFPEIEIIDPETDVVLATQQPVDGEYDFSLLPEQFYKIKVRSFGYEEQTYKEGDIFYCNNQEYIINEPEKENIWLSTDQTVGIGFQMDELGSIEIQTGIIEDEEFVLVGNISFRAQGTKFIGTDSEGSSIYKYIYNGVTDLDLGNKILSNLEFDSYSFSITSSIYDLSSTDPLQPIDLFPGESKIVKLILEAENTLLVNVIDSSNSSPVFGANVRLYNIEYDQILPTNHQGEAFFLPLEAGEYDLEVSSTGYSNYYEEVVIFQGQDKEIGIELIPI